MDNKKDSVQVDGTRIECVVGNIVKQPDMDAVVNAANAQMLTGGGVAGAIHRAAGPELERECRPLAPIRPVEAVITGAGRLPNRHVIHTLGPVYGRDTPPDKLLADCYRNSLRRAEERELVSVAFPAISTGAFGYPSKEAAKVAFRAIKAISGNLTFVKRIRFVLWSELDYNIHRKMLTIVLDA